MERIRKSSTLKILSYILIPILVLTTIMGIAYIQYNSYNKQDLERKDYYCTDNFVNNEYYNYLRKTFRIYTNNVEGNVKNTNIKEDNSKEGAYNTYIDNYVLVKEEPNPIYYAQNYTDYYNGFNHIIIDENGIIYTSIQAENYNSKIEQIKKSKYYWYKEDENIYTDLEQINETGLSYNYGIENLKELKNSRFDIYIFLDEEQIVSTEYKINKAMYNFISSAGSFPVYLMVISIILLFIIAIYLFWSIGHSKGVEGIYLSKFDKTPYEVILVIAIIVVCICMSILDQVSYTSIYIYEYIAALIAYFIGYIACAIVGVTTIKRIKAGMFIKTTLTYKICKWLIKKIKEIGSTLVWNKQITTKVIIYYIAFLIISLILIITAKTGISIILLLAFWAWTLYKILNYFKQLNSIKTSLKDIYEGKENVKINVSNIEKNLKDMAEYINSLSTGLTKAVEESLKSERMKTELITNVSHDIKTPLTSIINYVDLLKKEEMPNEKAKEYLEVLDKKSQRLKRLTEDLVEASKASSGNIKLNIEKINVKELIKQISGEFEDKFKERNLELILNIPNEDTIINADSRYLYRVVENMYSNIVKYALEGSRVYVDILNNKDKIQIDLKNISKEKLNITADELMQRFVRGEASRNTEGSGLGLSIAESLTKLQKGNFNIYLDGDLFKVTIEFGK